MFSHPKRALVELSLCAAAGLSLVLGCSGGSDLPPPGQPAQPEPEDGGAGGSSRGTDDAGDTGGSAAAAGGEDTEGQGGNAAAGSSSTDGGASPGAAGDGPVDPRPTDTSCSGERAFAVTASAFVSPTPKALAEALNADTFDSSPLTVVLRNDGEAPLVAASYTQDSAGKQIFHPGLEPELTPAWLTGDTFGTETAQPHGYLLVSTQSGPLEVPLDNVSFSLSTSDRCGKGVATLSGVIPADHADLVDTLTGASAGGSEDPGREAPADTPVSAIFSVELVDFDFGSLP